MNESEFCGTKLQRKPPQQMPPQQQQMPPQQQQMPPQQQQMQQQQMHQMPPQQQQMQQQFIRAKESFSKIDSKSMKYAILVILIFIILNSKIIWKQLMRLPMMGGAEPSIIALFINSILAGIVFYFISNYIKV